MAEKDKDRKVAFTNPNTGITTYQEPTAAAAKAPSTATSLTEGASPGMLSQASSPTSSFFGDQQQQPSDTDLTSAVIDYYQTLPGIGKARARDRGELYAGLLRSYLDPGYGQEGSESFRLPGPLAGQFNLDDFISNQYLPYAASQGYPNVGRAFGNKDLQYLVADTLDLPQNQGLRDALLGQLLQNTPWGKFATPEGLAKYINAHGQLPLPFNEGWTVQDTIGWIQAISVALPAIGGIIGAAAGAAAEGAGAGASTAGAGASTAASTAATEAGTQAGAQAGAQAGTEAGASTFGNGLLSNAALQAAKAAILAKIQGASLGQSLVAGAKAGALSAATQGAVDYLGSTDQPTPPPADVSTPPPPPPLTATTFDPKRGMLAGGDQFFSPNSYMMQPGFVNANSVDEALANSTSPVTGDLTSGVTYLPGTFSGYDPTTGQPVFNAPPTQLPAPSAPNQSQENAPAAPSKAQQQNVTSMVVNGALKALSELRGGGGSPPSNAPVRQSGQSDEQYASSLVKYARTTGGFDASKLKGLTPGTAEFYNAVLDQMDSVINRLSAGLDLNASDLVAQFRGRSAAERSDLERALYVRGQLGQLMGSGRYLDPFTGNLQQIDTAGAQVNPGRAAYESGLAGSAETLAGLDPSAAYGSLQGMLSRTPDLYGLQATADARRIAEILAAQGIDPRKLYGSGGMLDVNSLAPQDLAALLA